MMDNQSQRTTFWQLVSEDFSHHRRRNHRGSTLATLFDRYFWIVANYRFGHWATGCPTAGLRHAAKLLYFLMNLWISTVTSSDIRPGARIGRRFRIHTSRGLLITNNVQIGDECVVNNGVCIVHRANKQGQGVPTLGDRVWIGVGAKILGGVTVGDDVMIGANAVVTHDIPSNSTAVGIPARARPGSPRLGAED